MEYGRSRAAWARRRLGLIALVCAGLTACGGGGESADTTAVGQDARQRALAVPGTTGVVAAASDSPASYEDSTRFAAQATFGMTDAALARFNAIGYSAWIDEQFALPASSHRLAWQAKDAAIKAIDPLSGAGQDQVFESFWQQAVTAPDQLRQRVAYALSQIFVTSMVDPSVGDDPRAAAAWLDMLGEKSFTTYRELLESVTLHPVMGLYLSHARNQKASATTGRVPDENYAREVMQLFSIGLVQLNPDGTAQLDASGKPIETYTQADISGIARVFTGFSWTCLGLTNNSCFFNGSSAGASDPDRTFKAMVGYPQYHSTEVKRFLGVTIPVQATANPTASLRVALDTLNAHANVGPFLSRQLIQRLVSSNPSPAYVAAVASVFANNGAGVRGDLKAVVKAILLHPEARTNAPTTGKVREPVLRLAAFMRAFPHRSDTGDWKVGNTDSVGTSLGQTPLRSPSVFNFYRPGYVSPNSRSSALGLVAPELQLVHETSVASYVNFMRDNVSSGVGQFNGTVGGVVFNRRDIQPDFTAELAVADNAYTLVNRVANRLIAGAVSRQFAPSMTTAINSIVIPAPTATNAAAVAAAKRTRVNSAVLLVLASPEFQVQK